MSCSGTYGSNYKLQIIFDSIRRKKVVCIDEADPTLRSKELDFRPCFGFGVEVK